MDQFEKTLDSLTSNGIRLIDEKSITLPNDIKAVYYSDHKEHLIIMSGVVQCKKEKNCILSEELGHYHTTSGDILCGSSALNTMKQEETARRWADDHLLSPMAIADAIRDGCMCEDDLVDHFCVTHEYLHSAINRYICRYGIYFEIDEMTMLCFMPLGLLKLF